MEVLHDYAINHLNFSCLSPKKYISIIGWFSETDKNTRQSPKLPAGVRTGERTTSNPMTFPLIMAEVGGS
ncbi:hypothetical protein SPLC1_S100210 [Arthrospira platensis C1]|nr:hypothetical protein SPLC1_S100210 [Arthrospira platensis C1]